MHFKWWYPSPWCLQFMLGGMYYQGLGVEQNFTKAFALYKVRRQRLKVPAECWRTLCVALIPAHPR